MEYGVGIIANRTQIIIFTHNHENNAIPVEKFEIKDFQPGLEKKSFKILVIKNPNMNPKNTPLKRIFVITSNSGGMLSESVNI